MEPIPLASFFDSLRRHGFSVTHSQIITSYKIILRYGDKVKADELCLYLVPAFAGSGEEQELFKQIFNKEFVITERLKLRKTLRQQIDAQSRKNPYKLVALYFAIALAVIYFIKLSYSFQDKIIITSGYVNLENISKDKEYSYSDTTFKVHANHELVVQPTYKDNKGKREDVTIKAQYNWGDTQLFNDISSHKFIKAGQYKLTAFVVVISHDKILLQDSLHYLVIVCPDANLAISVSEKENFIPVGRKIFLKASVDKPANEDSLYIQWKEGETLLGRSKYLQLSFDSAGSHQVNCIVKFHSNDDDCSLVKEISLNIGKEPNPPANIANKKPDVNAIANQVELKPINKKILYWLYAVLAILFGALAVVFFNLYQKAVLLNTSWKSKEENPDLELTSLPVMRTTSPVFSFKNNDHLIADMPLLTEIAKALRNRISDNNYFLNIEKTIRKSVNAGGLFQEVRIPKTLPPEYLFLIDKSSRNGNMVWLSEYLATFFKRHTISVDKFYYATTLEKCYSPGEAGFISFDKLSARYNKHVLLVLGDAHHFNTNFPTGKENNFIIRQWNYKAIITPTAYNNWDAGIKEIASSIPVVPFDAQALSALAENLFSEASTSAIDLQLKKEKSVFYKIGNVDFEDVDQLEIYLRQAISVTNNAEIPIGILFEWVQALAVYPVIHKDIILAIGKAIFDKHDVSYQFNYTCLLPVVNIDWIRQCVFPEGIRLELLKGLSPGNEVTARQAVLTVLEEMNSGNSSADAVTYEERETQKVINEFMLYASDSSVHYEYRKSLNVFKNMWRNDKLTDIPLKLYLANKDNLWETLPTNNAVNKNKTIDKYFEAVEREETNLSKAYLALSVISIFVFITSCFALMILYRWSQAGL